MLSEFWTSELVYKEGKSGQKPKGSTLILIESAILHAVIAIHS